MTNPTTLGASPPGGGSAQKITEKCSDRLVDGTARKNEVMVKASSTAIYLRAGVPSYPTHGAPLFITESHRQTHFLITLHDILLATP